MKLRRGPAWEHPAWRLAHQLEAPAAAPTPTPRWDLATVRGRLCELAAPPRGGAALSAAARLVLDAQRRGEPVAWIAGRDGLAHPPDLAGAGVDLMAMPVVRAPHAGAAAKAADRLLRSGAFGLVVLDLGGGALLPNPAQGRLVQLAQRHDTGVLCLTRKTARDPSLGSLVSLRAQASRRRLGPGRFGVTIDVLKDKRSGPGWRVEEVYGGPDGLH